MHRHLDDRGEDQSTDDGDVGHREFFAGIVWLAFQNIIEVMHPSQGLVALPIRNVQQRIGIKQSQACAFADLRRVNIAITMAGLRWVDGGGLRERPLEVTE